MESTKGECPFPIFAALLSMFLFTNGSLVCLYFFFTTDKLEISALAAAMFIVCLFIVRGLSHDLAELIRRYLNLKIPLQRDEMSEGKK